MSVRVKSFSLDAIGYLPLYPSEASWRVEIINSTSVVLTLRSDPTDATTAITVLPGESKVFESVRNAPPYDSGRPIIYGILATGTGTVKVLAH